MKLKRILVSIVGLLIILILTLVIFEQYQKNKDTEAQINRKEKRRQFEKDNDDLHKTIQKAVKVDFEGIQNDSLIFVIQNNTNQHLKNVRYQVRFQDDFGDDLESRSHNFFYSATSKELALSPKSKLETSVSCSDIKKDVSFDFERYKNSFNLELRTTQFTIVNGDQFGTYWKYEEGVDYSEKHGPLKNIAQIKKLLK